MSRSEMSRQNFLRTFRGKSIPPEDSYKEPDFPSPVIRKRRPSEETLLMLEAVYSLYVLIDRYINLGDMLDEANNRMEKVLRGRRTLPSAKPR